MFYHRVNRYGDYFGMDTDIFEQQIKYLSRNFNLISLEELFKIFNEEIIVKKPLLLTLDDGYCDNYTDAYPILKKYSAPAVIFLTTDFIDKKMWIWHDLYRYIIENTPMEKVSVKLGDCEFILNLSTKEGIRNARKIVCKFLKDFSASERLEQINSFAKSLQVLLPEVPTKKYAPLSWSEIKEMSKNNIEFGAHTCTHEILSKLKREDAYYELSQSKKRIEEEYQVSIKAFAYPNGQPGDFTDDTRKLVKECGYQLAFTTIAGSNDVRTDKLLIKRISPGDKLGIKLVGLITGMRK